MIGALLCMVNVKGVDISLIRVLDSTMAVTLVVAGQTAGRKEGGRLW